MKVHGPYALQMTESGEPAANSIGDPLIHHSSHAPSSCVPAYIIEQANPIFSVLDRADDSSVSDEALGKMLRAYKNEIRAKSVPRSDAQIDDQLAHDRLIYGSSFERIDADGTRSRLDPCTTEIRDKEELARCTSLKMDAEVGKPWTAEATFQGDAVKMFAAHLVQWFRTQGGDNYITVAVSDPDTGEQFELTMQRCGGKTPAQTLTELRRQIEELRGKHQEPISELVKRLPNLRSTLPDEITELSIAALQRRVLIQADWIASYARCIDGRSLNGIPGSGLEGARDPRDIGRIVDQLRALLREIYDADKAAIDELRKMGAVIEDLYDPKFTRRIEQALDIKPEEKKA